MKKQKILFGILAFVLIANFIIPNIVLATDELIDEVETVQEEVVTEEKTTTVEDAENIVEEIPTTISEEKQYSEGYKYESRYNANKTDVVAKFNDNKTLYLPVELDNQASDTRLLQSLFLLDKVGNIAATKQITTLTYGKPYETANYRLMETSENPMFRVTPVDDNDNYSSTPTKYKVELISSEQEYNQNFMLNFDYHNEHAFYDERYNEETGLYDRYSIFNIYPTLRVHFVLIGDKAVYDEYVVNEAGEYSATYTFDENNQCKLELYSSETGTQAELLIAYFDMYLAKDDNNATIYANIKDGKLTQVSTKEDAMFEIIMEDQFNITINWLKDNTKHTSATADEIELLKETHSDESSNLVKRTYYMDNYSPVCFNFAPGKKEIVYEPDLINEKGSKNLNILFDENNTAKIAADNTKDVYFVMENLFLWYDGEGERYFFVRDTGWGSSEFQTEESILKVTTVNVSGNTESPKYEITIELLKDLSEPLVREIPEYFEYVGYKETEDEDHQYLTYEYDRYEPATLTFVPYGIEVNYYVENVEVDNENDTAMFEFSVDYDKFLKEGTVYLDGKALNEDQYTSRQGSTIIELTKDILDTLSIGVHTLGIEVNDGYVEAAFQIIEEAVQQEETIVEEPVNTADYTPYMISLFIMSLMGIIYAKRKLVVNK